MNSIKSISIVGLEKNTGKTQALNFFIDYLRRKNICLGVTSIGIDGESTDQVTLTQKPRIRVYKNMIFSTCEKFYKEKDFVSEILNVGEDMSALGRTVTARAKEDGMIILSGPSIMSWMKKNIDSMLQLGCEKVLVDGAISRLSSSSPDVTDAMILSTGAALTLDMNELVRQTKYKVDLALLKPVDKLTSMVLATLGQGVWTIERESMCAKKLTDSPSVGFCASDIKRSTDIVYINGVVSSKVLKNLCSLDFLRDLQIVVTDFTKVFADHLTYEIFVKKAGGLKVLNSVNLVALTVNPTSPSGYSFNSETLKNRLRHVISVPVIDVLKDGDIDAPFPGLD